MRMKWLAMLVFAILPVAASAQLPPPVPRPPPENCTAPEHRQLDFWIGDWDVYVTGTDTMVGRSRIESIYNGCALREGWSPFDMNEGGSLSGYDPVAGGWWQAWTDSRAERIDYRGRFENGRMVLIANRPAQGELPARLNRIIFTPEGETVRQVGEASSDGGRGWATSYDYTYRRHGTRPPQ